MGDKPLGVLIHGAGLVSAQHLAAYVNNPMTEVVAISSRSRTSASQRAAEGGLADVALYCDFDEALKHTGVDVVSICTPQHLHCQNVLAAAAEGKPRGAGAMQGAWGYHQRSWSL